MTETPSLHVFTFKEGLLSVVAHDLSLRFERFAVELSEGELRVEVDVDSLRVDGAVKRGRVQKDALGPTDHLEIERNAKQTVLQADRHPQARFAGQVQQRVDGFEVQGELVLLGVARPWSPRVDAEGPAIVAEGELVPSRWGIAPYRAMGGTLKVQDRVRVVARLPLTEPLLEPRSVHRRWSLP